MSASRTEAARVLSQMLERRLGGQGADARNTQLADWQREGKVGVGFGEYRYTTEDGEVLVVEEAFDQLGHRVWDTCIQVCKALERSPELVKGLRVVELGAGCGLLTAVAVKAGASCVATDLPQVTQHLEASLHRMLPGDTSTTVQPLIWGGPYDPLFTPVDVVLATDVTITSSAIPALLATIKHLLSPPSPASSYAIVAGPKHREGWQTLLQTAAADKAFDVRGFPPSSLHPKYAIDSIGVVTLRLCDAPQKE